MSLFRKMPPNMQLLTLAHNFIAQTLGNKYVSLALKDEVGCLYFGNVMIFSGRGGLEIIVCIGYGLKGLPCLLRYVPIHKLKNTALSIFD